MSSHKKKEPSELAFRNGSSATVVSPSTVLDSSKYCASGQSLEDSEPIEFSTKFSPKMKAKEFLADSFYRLGTGRSSVFNEFSDGFEPIHTDLDRAGYTSRSFRVRQCGSSLSFAYGIFDTGELDSHGRLQSANFCKDRLCPMCGWRRSLKIFGQTSQIMDVIGSKFTFLFLTLTVPNCIGEDLNFVLDSMNHAFYNMKRNKKWKSVVKGFHRVLEITVNQRNGTYHPHFHVILAVNLGYLHSHDYISHGEWLSMWQQAMNDFSIRMVNIKVIRPKLIDGVLSMSDAVAEVSKYAVKSSDFLGKFDKAGNLIQSFSESVIDSRVFYLSSALYGRQLSVFGGVFYDAQKALKLDDAVDGDLIHIQDDKLNPYVAELIVRYNWRAGIGQYEQVSRDIKILEE